MKLFFLKDHSLYKIFKTLEKIPNKKTIWIYIDPEHAFFDNERRGKQIQEILEKKQLNAFFVTKTEKARTFFLRLGLQIQHQEQHKIVKVLRLAYLFFFNMKKFHLLVYTKKSYIFYTIFILEVSFIIGILYFLYSLIIPKTVVKIHPSNHIENIIYNFRYYPSSLSSFPRDTKQLSISYTTGAFSYKYTMSMSTENIRHIQKPSMGYIKITNKTPQTYTLLKGTRFETANGLVFKSLQRFKIPGQTGNIAGESFIRVAAADQDSDGIIIGARGNIKKGTSMYIKNLNASYFLKQVYAVNTEDFTGGSVSSEGTISQKDIDLLSGKLVAYINKNKTSIVTQYFSFPDQIFLNFEDLIKVQIQNIVIANKTGEKASLLQGYVIANIGYTSIKQEDLIKQVSTYLKERPSDKVKILNIDKNSVVFFPNLKKEADKGIYTVPTKISAIESYDFEKDINGIKDQIKDAIVGINKEEAKEALANFPEIGSASLVVRPPRYTSITKLKSRISLQFLTD